MLNTFTFTVDLTTGIPANTNPEQVEVSNQPNPVSQNTTFIISGDSRFDFSNARLIISDASGKIVSVLRMNKNIPEEGVIRLEYNNDHHFAEGNYFYSLISHGDLIATGKMTICK